MNENVTNGKADAHEGLDLYKPVDNPDQTKPLWGTNQWPDVPGFREKYERWVGKMKGLGIVVMEASVFLEYVAVMLWDSTNTVLRMASGLGLTSEEWQELRSQVDDSFWVMRIIGA